MKMKWLSILAFALFFTFSVHASFAQSSASIDGTVVDQGKAIVSGARVTLTNTQTGLKREAISSSEGYFVLSDLVPGDYKVEVSSTGFKTWVQAERWRIQWVESVSVALWWQTLGIHR